MCLGGSKKQSQAPQQKPMPKPDPTPTPVAPTEVSAMGQKDRRKKLSRLRYGLSSTIKTSSRGVKKAASLLTPTLIGGKSKLGE